MLRELRLVQPISAVAGTGGSLQQPETERYMCRIGTTLVLQFFSRPAEFTVSLLNSV